MMTITAKFANNDSLSAALLALARDDIHTDRATLERADEQVIRPTNSDSYATMGGALGIVAGGTAGVVAMVSTGDAAVATGAVVVAAASSAAAGGMAGGLVGAFIGGETRSAKLRSDDDEHAPVVLTIDIRDDQAFDARRVLLDAGGLRVEARATNPGSDAEDAPATMKGAS